MCCLWRYCVFSVLSVGPLPHHIAFIMDGNRRYAKKYNFSEGAGHRLGYVALMNMIKYCYELNIKFVNIYTFSIDNFRRCPEEIESTMQLIQEKIENMIKEESLVSHYGVRVYFLGNMKLLSGSVRLAAERVMESTAGNSKSFLCICLAYTSTKEILRAVQECCDKKRDETKELEPRIAGNSKNGTRGNENERYKDTFVVHDVEKHMYASVAPDPDILIRTSGKTRLRNFLLWQTTYFLLYATSVFWLGIGFRHLVCAVMEFQRNVSYLKHKLKQS